MRLFLRLSTALAESLCVRLYTMPVILRRYPYTCGVGQRTQGVSTCLLEGLKAYDVECDTRRTKLGDTEGHFTTAGIGLAQWLTRARHASLLKRARRAYSRPSSCTASSATHRIVG